MEELFSIKEEINALRNIIETILCEEGNICRETILCLSRELDELILKYMELERSLISSSSRRY